MENTPNFQHIDEQSNCYERTILRVCQFFTITGGEVLVYSISKDPNQSIILLMNSHLYVMSAAWKTLQFIWNSNAQIPDAFLDTFSYVWLVFIRVASV